MGSEYCFISWVCNLRTRAYSWVSLVIALIPHPGDNNEVSEWNLSRAALCCDFTVSAYSRPAFRQHMVCHGPFAPDCAAKYLYAGSLLSKDTMRYLCLRGEQLILHNSFWSKFKVQVLYVCVQFSHNVGHHIPEVTQQYILLHQVLLVFNLSRYLIH